LYNPAVSNQLRPMSNRQIGDAYGTRGADTPSTCGTTRQSAARQKPGHIIVSHLCNWIMCCNAYKPSNTLMELRMILLSQISPDQCPIDKYKMLTVRGELIRKLRTRHGAARQKPDRVIERHFCDWAVCRNAYRPSPWHLKTPERCVPRRAGRGASMSRLCKS